MNIVITGALGHIGSGIIYNLSKIRGLKEVYLVDNLSSNNINVLFDLNLNKIKIKFLRGDLRYKTVLNSIATRIDVVIHLASITNVEQSFKLRKFIFENNFGIFKNIVSFCKKKNAKLVHLSSTSVYGHQSNSIDERTDNLLPQSPYAEEKVMEEQYLKKNLKKLKFVTLRLGTIAGISKGMRFHTAVNKFCLSAILKEKIPIWGNALKLYRPYLSIEDTINTIFFFINKKKFNNEIYNIITSNYTVTQVLNIIKRNNIKLNIKKIKSPIINQMSYKVSRKKILKTGLKLKTSIEKDIKLTLKILKGLY